jgi:glycosyltransferase involved in cell wall biosynthesis
VSAAIWGLVRATATHGIRHSAISVDDEACADDLQRACDACDVRIFAQRGLRSAFYSPSMGRYLRNSPEIYDVIHVHSIRHWPGLMARRYAMSRERPLLISLHGMLYPEHLKQSRLRKQLIHTLFENSTLRAAHCLHATSPQELQSIRQFGCRNPIAMIPLGINEQPSTNRSEADEHGELIARWPPLAGKRLLLYLGMLDSKKGLLRLMAAWARLHDKFSDWQLVIAGPDVHDHEADIRAAVVRAELARRVTFLGPVYGNDKAAILRHADLLILPSDWENFGIVVGEALSVGTPVIASRTSPWQAIEAHDCGWWIEPSVESVIDTLQVALSTSRAALAERGQRGQELIRAKFRWDSTGKDLDEVYTWLSGRRSQPGCVDRIAGSNAGSEPHNLLPSFNHR